MLVFVVFVKIGLAWAPDCSHAEQQCNHLKCVICFYLNHRRSAGERDYSRTLYWRNIDSIRAVPWKWPMVNFCNNLHLKSRFSALKNKQILFFCLCWEKCWVASPCSPIQLSQQHISCNAVAHLCSQLSSPVGTHLSWINIHLHINPHFKIISWQEAAWRSMLSRFGRLN